jgi:hypothetical protein
LRSIYKIIPVFNWEFKLQIFPDYRKPIFKFPRLRVKKIFEFHTFELMPKGSTAALSGLNENRSILWQQTGYAMGGGATDFMFLVLAASSLLQGK